MNRDTIYNIIIEQYEYLYGRVTHFNDYDFTPTPKQRQQVYSFIDLLDSYLGLSSIGKEWVFNYLTYLFKIRSEQKTRFEGRIPLNWIIGKKALEIYKKKPDKWLYFNDLFLSDRNIPKKYLNEKISIPSSKNSIKAYASKLDNPIDYCLGNTTYDPKSKYCLICKNKKMCKEINGND